MIPTLKIDQTTWEKITLRPGTALVGHSNGDESRRECPEEGALFSAGNDNGPMGLRRNRAELSCACLAPECAKEWSSYFYHHGFLKNGYVFVFGKSNEF